jgi:hypothetical protein
MQSLAPDYLAKLRFDARQLATLRALGEYRGKQQLFVAQSPEILSDLRQVAVVESTESSNRLEGVVVAAHRLKSLVLKNATPQSRSEQEVAGYRDALGLIHESGEQMPFRKVPSCNYTACCTATCPNQAGNGRRRTMTLLSAILMAAHVFAFVRSPHTSPPWRLQT